MPSANRLGSAAATFSSPASAEAAVQALREAGFDDTQLSAVVQPQTRGDLSGNESRLGELERIAVHFDCQPLPPAWFNQWARLGAGVGSFLGLALVFGSLGSAGLPGLTVGLLIGGLVGGALGALGPLSQRRLHYYLGERVRRRMAAGGVVVTVLAEAPRLELARRLLQQAGGHEVRILSP